MDKPHQAISRVEVLPPHFPIPGAGFLPINAFIIKDREPGLVDTGIRLLDHGVKRSAGTTDLYRRYRLNLSWRELGQMAERARQDLE